MKTDTPYQPFAWATICEHPVRRHPRREQGRPGWRTHALCHSKDAANEAVLIADGVEPVESCGPHRVVPLWYWPADAALVSLDVTIAAMPEQDRARVLAHLVALTPGSGGGRCYREAIRHARVWRYGSGAPLPGCL